jgi:hypothetical protein
VRCEAEENWSSYQTWCEQARVMEYGACPLRQPRKTANPCTPYLPREQASHFWRLIDLPLVEMVLAGVLASAIVIALVIWFGR